MVNRVTVSTKNITEPYLLQFATERSNKTSRMTGYYCETRQLWVIDVDGVTKPIIEEAANMLAQTQTNTTTEVLPESDDLDPSLMLFELLTKTEVMSESDDPDPSLITI